MPDFPELSTVTNLGVFAVAAALVWWSGSSLSRYAEVIAARTRLSQGFVGLLLLSAATSLPEMATTGSAISIGAPRMAVNNLLGGVALQTVVMAIADIGVRRAVTWFTPGATLLLQGVVLLLLIAVTLATLLGDLPALGHVGVGTGMIFAGYLVGLWVIRSYERRPAWIPSNGAELPAQQEDEDLSGVSLKRAAGLFTLFAGVILVAGWVIAEVGSALAEQTGLGQSFIGATFVALATSLPELSARIAAVRRGAYALAIANMFGSNIFCLALLFPADLLHTDGPILDSADRSAGFAAAIGSALTCICLWGMIERRDRAVWRLGVDSFLVLIFYAGGLVVLYRLRDG